MPLQYSPEFQRKVDEKIAAGCSISSVETETILKEIHSISLNAEVPLDDKRYLRIAALTATLNASLSAKADRVQRWMVALTVLIAIMTLILLWTTVVPRQPLPGSHLAPQTNNAHPNANHAQP